MPAPAACPAACQVAFKLRFIVCDIHTDRLLLHVRLKTCWMPVSCCIAGGRTDGPERAKWAQTAKCADGQHGWIGWMCAQDKRG